MESWCYFSGDKEYVIENPGLGNSENGSRNSGLMSWAMSPSISIENSMECSNQKSIENQELVEMGSTQMMMNILPKNSEKVLYTANAFCGAKDEPSSLVFDSNKRDSSLIDLKLGRTLDLKETRSLNRNLSWKRARPQTAFCQVYGCRKDLSSSKDYHRRHKVCEVHSKTAKVIVNGIEQRFCQQCSRFHVLAEFDNGKRSCRKRLAGHNERRRKPHVVMNSSRVGRFQDYNGSRFQATTSTSSISRLNSKLMHQHKYKVDDWIKLVKVEYGDDWNSPKSLSIPHTSANLNFPFLVGENSVLARSKIDGLSMQNNVMCSDICSSSLCHSSSVTQEPNSGRALSLLSTVPQDSTNTSSLVRTDGDSCYDSTTGMAKVSHSSWINLDENCLQPLSVLNSNIGSVHYGDNPIIQGRDYSYPVSEGDPTINLLALPSQLLQVEQTKAVYGSEAQT